MEEGIIKFRSKDKLLECATKLHTPFVIGMWRFKFLNVLFFFILVSGVLSHKVTKSIQISRKIYSSVARTNAENKNFIYIGCKVQSKWQLSQMLKVDDHLSYENLGPQGISTAWIKVKV